MSEKDDKKIEEGTSKIKEIGSTTHFRCPMLKGANYTTWAIRMQVILEAIGLWEMIEPYLTTEVDTKKDKTAIAYIYQSLPEDQLLLISKYKTAKAVWDALKKRHVGEDRVQQAKQQTLKSEFEMLQMEENELIDSFVTRLADTISLDEAIGRLKTFEERLKYKNERPVNTQERLLFAQHEDQGQQFRRRSHGGFNQSRGQENKKFRSKRKNWESSQNNFKKETNINSNKFTYDKSKVLCFKCKDYGHFANKCPSKKEEQSNLIEEDLEPTLLMATVEEAPGSFINQEESRSKNGRKFIQLQIDSIKH
nr:hypothetical protein [Tanacetum cinerariifolium]